LRFFGKTQTQNQTFEYFKAWNILKMTENYIIIVLKTKFWGILTLIWLKVFLYWIFIVFEKIDESFEKKFAKFSTNGFLVLSKQSRTKLKDCHINQNPTKTRWFPKFGTKPNPNRTEPKRTGTVATLISILWVTLLGFFLSFVIIIKLCTTIN
jgi:hypothetical protein